MGAITSSIATLVAVFLPLIFLLPFMEIVIPSWKVILLGISAGVLIQISQVLYFQSLGYSEAGIVSAYWNLIPVFIILIGFIVFGRTMSLIHIIGVAILIVASTFMIKLDSNFDSKLITFFLMVAASLLQAIAYIFEDIVFDYISFTHGFILLSIGLVIAGLSPLLLPSIRTELKKNTIKLAPVWKIFLIMEIINLMALAFAQGSVSIGNPAFVSAVETTIPAFVFILSISLFLLTKNKFGDPRSSTKLPAKIIIVGTMVIGVFLISLS